MNEKKCYDLYYGQRETKLLPYTCRPSSLVNSAAHRNNPATIKATLLKWCQYKTKEYEVSYLNEYNNHEEEFITFIAYY